jgi:hypothetical protein
MKKIEEFESQSRLLDNDEKHVYLFTPEELEAYKATIREQVVLDALPSETINIADHDDEIMWKRGYNQCVDTSTQRLTTREEAERPFVELLMECKLQLEYLNQKFTETGTTNTIIARINQLTDGK